MERERAGRLLQIVPTISAYTANGGSNFILSGSGFAEGHTSVVFSAVTLDDLSRSYRFDVYANSTRLSAWGPDGVSRSLLRVRTVGGTSAAFLTGQP